MKTNLERGKRMKKKGFTLIELLAVIVILAIIALIAVPVVMNIISKANKSAFKDSAYGILKAGENYYMGELLKAEGMTEDKTFTFPDDTVDLEISGSKPTGGTMTINKKGQIAMAITNGRHCVKKDFEDEDVTITDDDGNCKLAGVNTLSDLATTGTITYVYGTDEEINEVHPCATSGICEAGTAFAIKVNDTETYKFYVLADDGKELTLIMDRNLYGEGYDPEYEYVEEEEVKELNEIRSSPWISEEDIEDDGSCVYVSCNAQGPKTALKKLKERTSGWTNIPEYTYTLKNDYDGHDGEHTYPDITGELVTNVRARLPKYTELFEFAIEHTEEDDDGDEYTYYEVKDFLKTNGAEYWTSTAHSLLIEGKWRIISTGVLNETAQANLNHVVYSGIRPVIILSK